MTKTEKIQQAICFAMRVKSIASSIKSEGDDYDMRWHKGYCEQLTNTCDSFLDKVTSKRR